jgi:hypothetical protein
LEVIFSATVVRAVACSGVSFSGALELGDLRREPVEHLEGAGGVARGRLIYDVVHKDDRMPQAPASVHIRSVSRAGRPEFRHGWRMERVKNS